MMAPDDFRSCFRAKLIHLDELRRPRNPNDVTASPDTLTRRRSVIRSADRKRPAEDRALEFPNGATLRFKAEFEKLEGRWEIIAYSFHFVRAGGAGWFRYDRDPDAARSHEHPLEHLHVSADEPRFPTGPQCLLALLDFLGAQGLLD